MNIFDKENVGVFSILVVFFTVIVLFYSEDTPEDVYGLIYMTPLIIVAIMSFSLARVYRKVRYFYYAYAVLCIGFTAHVGAEILWLLMDYMGLEGYQSYPDIFYFTYGVMLLLHPWFIMKHFKIRTTRTTWLIISLFIIGGNTIYAGISNGYYQEDSFLYGLLFSTLANALLGTCVVAILALKRTKVHTVWLVMGISFLFNAVADIYYYSSENFTDWTQGDWVNIVWFIGFIILIYALCKQRYLYSIGHKHF